MDRPFGHYPRRIAFALRSIALQLAAIVSLPAPNDCRVHNEKPLRPSTLRVRGRFNGADAIAIASSAALDSRAEVLPLWYRLSHPLAVIGLRGVGEGPLRRSPLASKPPFWQTGRTTQPRTPEAAMTRHRQPKPPAAALIELIRRTPKPQTPTTAPGKPGEVSRSG